MAILRPILRSMFRPVLGDLLNKVGDDKPPFFDDLDGWYKPVDGNDFLESINDNDAKFLPRVCEYNGTDAYSFVADNGALDVNQATTDFCFGGYVKTGSDITTTQIPFGKDTAALISGRYSYYISAGELHSFIRTSDGNTDVADNIILAVNTEYFILTRIDITNSKFYFYIDNVLQNAGGTAFTGTFATLANQYEFVIGAVNNNDGSGVTAFFGGQLRDIRIYHKDVSGSIASLMNGDILGDEVLMVPNNDPSWAYDVSVNAYHMQSFNVVADYADTVYYYPATNGYSLWQKVGSDDIQVPFDLTGSAIALTPGVDIPTGYTKTRDLNGAPATWNMADCLVGFNEGSAADTELEIFDRQNAVRQSDFSRASIYYDATSLATRSRYHILEITTPNVYSDFFNVGYKGRIFAKIRTVLNGGNYDIIRYDEELNYATDKTGADEYKVMVYCGLKILVMFNGTNQAILDGDNYVEIT